MADKVNTWVSESYTGVFDMENGFLDLFKDSEDFSKYIVDNNIDLTKISTDDIGAIILYFFGYVFCILAGIILLIALPIAGCCKCCCCCCSNTPKYKEETKQRCSFKCKKICCGVTFFIMASFLLAGILLSFGAFQQLRLQVSQDSGVLQAVDESLYKIDHYLGDTAVQVEVAVIPPLQVSVDDMQKLLMESPSALMGSLISASGVIPALPALVNFTQSLPRLGEDFSIMNTTGEELDQSNQLLNISLAIARDTISNSLSQCLTDGNTSPTTKDQCQVGLDNLYLIAPGSSYDNLDDVSAAAKAINYTVSTGLVEDVNAGYESFLNMTQTIMDDTMEFVNDTNASIDEAEQEVEQAVHDVVEKIQNISVDAVTDSIDELKPDVEKYGGLVIDLFILISLYFTIVALLFFIGWLLGMFCKSPRDSTKYCHLTSKHGARFLRAASGLFFFLSLILCLLIVVLFAVGAPFHNFLCKPLLSGNPLPGNITDEFDIPSWFDLRAIESSCKKNDTLYYALDAGGLTNQLNISNTIDEVMNSLDEVINDLKNETINVPNVTLVYPGVNESIYYINEELQDIDFSTYTTALSDPVTKMSLDEYAQHLYDVAVEINNEGSPNLANDIRAEANNLTDIQTTIVDPMDSDRQKMGVATKSSETIVNSVDLPQTMEDLYHAEYVINVEGDQIVSDEADIILDNITLIIDRFVATMEYNLKNETGQCRPVYDAINMDLQAVCVYTLYPMNAIWFTYGWYLFFAIFTLAFADSLVKVFRTRDPHNTVNPEDGHPVVLYPMTSVTNPTKGTSIEPEPDYEADNKNQVAPQAGWAEEKVTSW